MSENKNVKIALLLGGTSPEREVSKRSGKSIYKALKDSGYNVKAIDPAYGLNQPEDPELLFEEKDFAEISNRNCITAINSPLLDGVDLVFLALHGRWGEDGTIQSLLELRGVKYTGSGVLASSLAMDKSMTKIMFQHYGVMTPKWFVVTPGDYDEAVAKDKVNKVLGYPCVLKPNEGGSTIGLTICNNENEIDAAVKLALKYSESAVVEEFIPGREVTVTVLEKMALPVLEIKPKHDLYDYECKYTHGMTEYIVPAQLPEEVAGSLQEQAIMAFKAVGCKSYSRFDFRLTEDNRMYCLEVNTLPGMTDTSLVPKMAKAMGMSFNELLERIIRLSL
ncbi:MAG: D-alanine--D-alanine ligase family protein [Bacteroidota bacterium]|jgi:D-alanine-D-alanine ligase|nr:D-alanine--D-alanine ligase [Ignavibacteria bacterium]MCU7499429.1 D-alanine--D-alanine ligase [Ignavibacteria bacterium]MCU7512739.1 D-alanine--D-alanine ligase [Ignavibacteria bacterium]MCU7522637.1 D-alanine--D-alanine ligase [Ignavibacteria bacterium]MCU7524441.1 D-alanine--D-alanine ligase [Ignavibacteria bacterium]